ncbi:hypothetical protein [Mycobacterium ulcerans]|uniref:hypothetical protein n=1 Tax=Mycobacterium ulcerans TaxID=1809 RepID=UPI0015D5E363|nr:hypothetical protein [Mycobacterium ulcerans]
MPIGASSSSARWAATADVIETPGLSADSATAARELALIRGGATPGSFTVTRPAVPA